MRSFSQAYEPTGNVTSMTGPAGTDNYSYDSLNRLTSENIAGYGNITYSYDPAGNRLQKTEPAKTGGPVLSLAMTRVYWASYSDWQNHLLSIDYSVKDNGPGTAYASQITGATATNGVYLSTSVPVALGDIAQGASDPVTLKYYIPSGVSRFSATVYADCQDQTGNVYAFPSGRTTYSYNPANQLASSYDQQGITTSYSYNAGGALTSKSAGTNITSFSYSGLDKLAQVSTPAATVSYAYDALGRRISRTDADSTTNYQLNGKSDLTDYETDATGKLTGADLRGADGLISRTGYTGQTPATSYYLYDPHGDTSAITDQNGNVSGSYRYDSFGNAIAGSPPADGYTGKWQRETDTATGMIRMGAREYDPALGRFTSADALQGDVTNPQQRNRYPYVGNDPLSKYDLSGLYWGESYVNAAIGAGEDYLSGGTPALANDWWEGFNSMSTKGKVAIVALPAAPIAALGGVETGGVGGAIVWGGETLSAEAPEVEDLLEGGRADCPDKVQDMANEIKDLLGDSPQAQLNDSGDLVIRNEENTLKIRFDFNNPFPHESPHVNIERFIDGQWVNSGPIYPIDVPQR